MPKVEGCAGLGRSSLAVPSPLKLDSNLNPPVWPTPLVLPEPPNVPKLLPLLAEPNAFWPEAVPNGLAFDSLAFDPNPPLFEKLAKPDDWLVPAPPKGLEEVAADPKAPLPVPKLGLLKAGVVDPPVCPKAGFPPRALAEPNVGVELPMEEADPKAGVLEPPRGAAVPKAGFPKPEELSWDAEEPANPVEAHEDLLFPMVDDWPKVLPPLPKPDCELGVPRVEEADANGLAKPDCPNAGVESDEEGLLVTAVGVGCELDLVAEATESKPENWVFSLIESS
jgi:hypothetical protein